MNNLRRVRALGALSIVLGVCLAVGPAAPAFAATTPGWSIGDGTYLSTHWSQVQVVCNIEVPRELYFEVEGVTRTLWDGGTVKLAPSNLTLHSQAKCLSGIGTDTAWPGSTIGPLYPTGGAIINNDCCNTARHGLVGQNQEQAHDTAEGWYSGEITFWGALDHQLYPLGASGWNNGVNTQRSWAPVHFTWVLPEGTPGGSPLTYPDRPAQAVAAGADPWAGPAYCDIIGVTGDVHETIPKDPAQTYRYEISFAGRNGHTAAPDYIGFSSSWQENTPAAKLPYSAVTTVSPDAIQQTADPWAGVAMWATPPAPSPLVIDIKFPEAKVYALRIGCLSDDGMLSYWVGGDLEPDPHTSQIAEDLAYQRLQECVPDGWSVLNPKSYAHTTSCVMLWLFKPRSLGDQWGTLQAAADGTVLQAGVGIATSVWAVPGQFMTAAGSGTCAGLSVNVAPGPLGEAGVIHPISACTGTAQTWATFVKVALRLGMVVGGGIFLVNMLMGIWGGPKINNESIDENGQGRMVL